MKGSDFNGLKAGYYRVGRSQLEDETALLAWIEQSRLPAARDELDAMLREMRQPWRAGGGAIRLRRVNCVAIRPACLRPYDYPPRLLTAVPPE